MTATTYKKAVIFFLVLFAIFVSLNAVIWFGWTRKVLAPGHEVMVGDLSRLGYLPDMSCERKIRIDTLPRHHVPAHKYRGGSVDMVVIGDSFAAGGGGGNDPFFQDHIASIQGLSVLNLPRYKEENQIQTVYLLLNTGYLDKIKPRFLLIEGVERDVEPVFGGRVDSKELVSLNDIATFYRQEHKEVVPEVGFINTGNFQFLLYAFLYHFSDHAYMSSAYQRKMRTSLFTHPAGDMLLFYKDDINNIPLINKNTVNKINGNLNALSLRLAAKGIKLYFMPAPDKYSLYQLYLIQKPSFDNVFELIRTLRKEYVFIDALEILRQLISKGEKDVYYFDDTHWSSKASHAVFSAFRFEL